MGQTALRPSETERIAGEEKCSEESLSLSFCLPPSPLPKLSQFVLCHKDKASDDTNLMCTRTLMTLVSYLRVPGFLELPLTLVLIALPLPHSSKSSPPFLTRFLMVLVRIT